MDLSAHHHTTCVQNLKEILNLESCIGLIDPILFCFVDIIFCKLSTHWKNDVYIIFRCQVGFKCFELVEKQNGKNVAMFSKFWTLLLANLLCFEDNECPEHQQTSINENNVEKCDRKRLSTSHCQIVCWWCWHISWPLIKKFYLISEVLGMKYAPKWREH